MVRRGFSAVPRCSWGEFNIFYFPLLEIIAKSRLCPLHLVPRDRKLGCFGSKRFEPISSRPPHSIEQAECFYYDCYYRFSELKSAASTFYLRIIMKVDQQVEVIARSRQGLWCKAENPEQIAVEQDTQFVIGETAPERLTMKLIMKTRCATDRIFYCFTG